MLKESLRYIENAKATLAKSPIEDNRYIDEKYVSSACGTAYRGVLKAIEIYLLSRGCVRNDLPKKVEEVRRALQKYAAHTTASFCANSTTFTMSFISRDKQGHILSTGYNGIPSGMQHCTEESCPRLKDRTGESRQSCFAVHAEANALLQCKDIDKIHACYVLASPCQYCICMLLNTPCQKIVYEEAYSLEALILWDGAKRQSYKMKVDFSLI